MIGIIFLIELFDTLKNKPILQFTGLLQEDQLRLIVFDLIYLTV